MKRLSLLLVLFIIFNCAEKPVTPNERTCIDTTASLVEATTNFNATTPDNYLELCNAYRIALENQKEFCGDGDGNIQTLLEGLGNCKDDGGTTSGFAMTFKLDGVKYNLNNPWGNNEASSSTIFSYYPKEEYILLQSRNGLFGNVEINLWIKRDHLIENTIYEVNENTDGTTTHIDLINLESSEFDYTVSGSITINFVDTTNKIVKGTFEFNSDEDLESHIITEGTFNYIYDVN